MKDFIYEIVSWIVITIAAIVWYMLCEKLVILAIISIAAFCIQNILYCMRKKKQLERKRGEKTC